MFPLPAVGAGRSTTGEGSKLAEWVFLSMLITRIFLLFSACSASSRLCVKRSCCRTRTKKVNTWEREMENRVSFRQVGR